MPPLQRFLHHENRFSILERKDPESAERLHYDLDVMNKERQARYVLGNTTNENRNHDCCKIAPVEILLLLYLCQ